MHSELIYLFKFPFRKIFLQYLARQTRTILEHLQSRSFKKSLMISVNDTPKWSFIWRISRCMILLICWRIQKEMLQRNPLNWILKGLNQLFPKWILRWRIFQQQLRCYVDSLISCPVNHISIGISIFFAYMPLWLPFQVAAQQGAYLASCFNRMEECEQNPEGPLRFRGSGRHRFHPFRYKFNSLVSHIYILDTC